MRAYYIYKHLYVYDVLIFYIHIYSTCYTSSILFPFAAQWAVPLYWPKPRRAREWRDLCHQFLPGKFPDADLLRSGRWAKEALKGSMGRAGSRSLVVRIYMRRGRFKIIGCVCVLYLHVNYLAECFGSISCVGCLRTESTSSVLINKNCIMSIARTSCCLSRPTVTSDNSAGLR